MCIRDRLMMGDEFGRTKKGNNNSYCQDNDISWLNWGLLNSNSSIHEFVKHVIQFRKEDVYKRQLPVRGYPAPDGGNV